MYIAKTYLTGLLILLITIVHAQTVWVADNNFNAPTGANVFNTIQAAVNAASDGDIVQVQPSPTTYGNASIDKQLTLMGIGFNVDKDVAHLSNMGAIYLRNNIDNSNDSDGTIITGLNFTFLWPGFDTGPDFVLENILIQNCQFQYLYNINTLNGYSPIDGFEIRDCYVWGSIGGYGLYFSLLATNVIIRNNVILYGHYFQSTTPGNIIISNNILFDGIQIKANGSNATILNNNFIASSGSDAAFFTEMKDCIVANNVFYGMTPSVSNSGNSTSTNFQRNLFNNNLVYSTGDDVMPPAGGGVGNTGSGNITGTSPLFTNVQLLNTWSSAYDFSLQVGSPALNAGSDGTDIGITGGAFPFPGTNLILKTSAVPVIQILNTTTVINPGDNLPVRIKVKSN